MNAEYILIPGAKEKIIFDSTKKPAPDYPLYFAKYPVTNKLYRHFMDYLDGKNKEALANLPLAQFERQLLANEEIGEFLGEDSKQWLEKFKREDDKRFSGDDQPVSRVSWYGAMAYCHWLTLLHQNSDKSKNKNESYIFRLPRDEEWEWAASGGKREYPWGKEEPDETRANYGEKVGHTTPVGAYPEGATPEGLMDMAGNVWEWCENLYGEGAYRPDARALRGGSWVFSTVSLRCAARDVWPPDGWDVDFGCRVVCAASHKFLEL
ncbi:MAG: Serine/threonine-protein kinase pkn1 [Syntrophorhabdaceae bacterium]|nr:Serine/threonine-protein kinase pkn1 [Syntrophorhabdaceae bacterium]